MTCVVWVSQENTRRAATRVRHSGQVSMLGWLAQSTHMHRCSQGRSITDDTASMHLRGA